MHDLNRNENRPRGTFDFPFEFHHIEKDHPRYVMSYHWHVEFELIRVLTGTLNLSLDEKSFPVLPGDVVFIHGGVLHSGIPLEGCSYQCIVFDIQPFLKMSSVISGLMTKIAHQEVLVYHHFTKEQSGIEDTINDIFEAFWKKPEGYELTVIGQFYHFFGLIFGHHYYLDSPRTTRRDFKRIDQLKQVVEFIEKNYTRQISLKELSASVSMSPKYFCRFFSEMTHQTPMDYLNRQRIEQACYQLTATDDSVTEIAYNTGFNDLSYFIRMFKKYKGIAPGRYKKGFRR